MINGDKTMIYMSRIKAITWRYVFFINIPKSNVIPYYSTIALC
jgi:hypothetical protein